jgi:hypothetical protein
MKHFSTRGGKLQPYDLLIIQPWWAGGWLYCDFFLIILE